MTIRSGVTRGSLSQPLRYALCWSTEIRSITETKSRFRFSSCISIYRYEIYEAIENKNVLAVAFQILDQDTFEKVTQGLKIDSDPE